MQYITKDQDGTWIRWQNEPHLVIPLDRNEGEYWEAEGEFEILGDFWEVPSNCVGMFTEV